MLARAITHPTLNMPYIDRKASPQEIRSALRSTQPKRQMLSAMNTAESVISGPVTGATVKSADMSFIAAPARRKIRKATLNASENHCRHPAR